MVKLLFRLSVDAVLHLDLRGQASGALGKLGQKSLGEVELKEPDLCAKTAGRPN